MQRDGYAPGPERRAEMAEAAGDGGAAVLTVARLVEGVGEDLVGCGSIAPKIVDALANPPLPRGDPVSTFV